MKKAMVSLLTLVMCFSLTACAKPAPDDSGADYGKIKSDFTAVTPEIAKAYLAVVEDISAHLGYEETEASEGECLHGGFVRDWDGDGVPELCLLLRTSPRDSGDYDGTPLYGWYPPTLYLYTYRNGQTERAGECDLYFGTAGREAAVVALMTGNGMQCVWWDRNAPANETYVDCYELANGAVQKKEASGNVAHASQGAETAQEFLNGLGAETAQLLLHNNSGEARIEGAANARELAAALAAKASR